MIGGRSYYLAAKRSYGHISFFLSWILIGELRFTTLVGVSNTKYIKSIVSSFLGSVTTTYRIFFFLRGFLRDSKGNLWRSFVFFFEGNGTYFHFSLLFNFDIPNTPTDFLISIF